MSQGRINGQVTRLADRPKELEKFMSDKTGEEKRQARIHLKMVKWLKERMADA